jgi:hypothetical protein
MSIPSGCLLPDFGADCASSCPAAATRPEPWPSSRSGSMPAVHWTFRLTPPTRNPRHMGLASSSAMGDQSAVVFWGWLLMVVVVVVVVVVQRECYLLCFRSQRSQSVRVQGATGSWSDKLPILKLMCALPAFTLGPAFHSGTALVCKTAKLH